MKCPICMNNQRYKEGMICRECEYQFALNPKEPPHISDMAFKNAVDRASRDGRYYFTYNQLFAQIYRIIKKKQREDKTGCLIFFVVFIGLFGFSVLHTFSPSFSWGVLVLYAIMGILGIVRNARGPVTILCSSVSRTISTYRDVHSTDHLVESRMFQEPSPEAFEEFFQYAPDRILIVERDDIADMLILNRFHLENKTLVVSRHKYPEHAFKACQQFLSQHPDIPVMLIHDASEKGLRMKKRILTDKSWNLREKNVQDLGLFPRDVKRLRIPMWLPKGVSVYGEILCSRKAADENISHGYRMPVDAAPPAAMMGSVSFALVSGLALLSEEFLNEQQRRTSVRVDFGEGFG
ncbi:hypothetical protein QUF72_03870 [Desulfobacterales bacterium HSG2]|nr:hypothetical protein [Desulfobacterales bacterium HSG2]